MDELSLYILDIAMNSVKADASRISIAIEENGNEMIIRISDDGNGVEKELIERLRDPFYTTDSSKHVGFGIPFFEMAAEMTGGYLKIDSVSKTESDNHGTTLEALFHTDHIDCLPFGDISSTIETLLIAGEKCEISFVHKKDNTEVSFSSEEIKKLLGDVSVTEAEVLRWIRNNIDNQYRNTI